MRTVIHGGDVDRLPRRGTPAPARRQPRLRGRPRRVRRPRRTPGPSDQRIDATGKLVIPGLVNLHCHATTEASGRLIADAGRRDFFHTGFLNYQTAPPGVAPLNARENLDIGNRFALVELLRNGCTTIVELGAVNDATVAFAGAIGIRAYLTPGYRSASYRLGPEGQLGYEWDEAAGMRGLERATRVHPRAPRRARGRIRGMLYPAAGRHVRPRAVPRHPEGRGRARRGHLDPRRPEPRRVPRDPPPPRQDAGRAAGRDRPARARTPSSATA